MAFKRWYCEFLHDDKAGDGVSWVAREAGAPLRSVAKKVGWWWLSRGSFRYLRCIPVRRLNLRHRSKGGAIAAFITVRRWRRGCRGRRLVLASTQRRRAAVPASDRLFRNALMCRGPVARTAQVISIRGEETSTNAIRTGMKSIDMSKLDD